MSQTSYQAAPLCYKLVGFYGIHPLTGLLEAKGINASQPTEFPFPKSKNVKTNQSF